MRPSAATSSRRATRASPISRSDTGTHDDDARVAQRGTEVERLGQRCDAEGGGARLQAGLRDVDRAVPVALGLHDRPQLGTARRTQQRLGVPADRAQVEGEARPLHGRILRDWRSGRQASSAAGRAATRSPATRPATCGTSRAARPCATAAAAAAVGASSPLERNDATTPVRTSPVPCGRQRRPAEVGDHDGAAGGRDERVRPLQENRRTEPVRPRCVRPRAGALRPRPSPDRAGGASSPA
jgi:hypothetical protein